MDTIGRTADWLRFRHGADRPAVAQDRTIAIVAVMASTLERQNTLSGPHSSLMARVRDELAVLPPQFAVLDERDAFAEWLQLGALAEHAGEPQLALIIIDALRELAERERDQSGAPHGVSGCNERIALCWTRRGRIARIAGQFDDARDYYREALYAVRRQPWRDAAPQAELGLAVLGTVRGNLQDASRRLQRLLARRPRVANIYRLPAHQMLALTMRKRGALIDALLHAWSAFDLLSADDFRRHELIVAISEVATDLGDWDAAAHGFDTVLASVVRDRIRIPALVGALRVWTLYLTKDPAAEPRVLRYVDEITAGLPTIQAPADRVMALVALGESALALGQPGDAVQWLADADDQAHAVGLFEQQFRIEALRTSLRQSPSPSDASPPIVRVETQRRQFQLDDATRHPTLRRLVHAKLP